MNIEENRLKTFNDWPRDAVVSPSRIAKAGFYSIKQNQIVECFSCHTKISEWNYGDQVMAKHRSLNPNCPFVLNPTTSGNVPIISSSTTTTTSSLSQQSIATSVPSSSSLSSSSSSSSSTSFVVNPENYKDESVRLRSFNDWPVSHIVTPERLARAGFYYLKIGDNTKCAYCKGVVRAWEPGDDPDREHQRHFNDCPFVLTEIVPRLNSNNTNNTPNSNNNNGSEIQKDNSCSSSSSTFINLNLITNEDLHYLGVHTHKGPKKPCYATLEARLKSFLRWPPDLIQTPDILAQAGFYYEGSGDGVRCFHCDGGLRHWDPQDDPWTEHARWFPRCSFVTLVKGQEFVNACSLEQNLKSNLEELDRKNVPVKKKEVSERELQEQLTSEVALSALSIGLNVERVKRAIREKLEQTGRGYSQPDALVEAALNLQHEEEDSMSYDDQRQQQQQQHNEQQEAPTYRQVKNVVANVLDTLVTGCLMENDGKTQHTTQQQINNSKDEVTTSTITTTSTIATTERLNKTVSLEEENRILKEARLCKICMDAEVGIVFLPCGHLTTCVNCAPNLEDCPVCRSAIKATVRTFLS